MTVFAYLIGSFSYSNKSVKNVTLVYHDNILKCHSIISVQLASGMDSGQEETEYYPLQRKDGQDLVTINKDVTEAATHKKMLVGAGLAFLSGFVYTIKNSFISSGNINVTDAIIVRYLLQVIMLAIILKLKITLENQFDEEDLKETNTSLLKTITLCDPSSAKITLCALLIFQKL